LLDAGLGVHGIAGDHGLDANGVMAADADGSDPDLAGGAAVVMVEVRAVLGGGGGHGVGAL